MMLPFTSYDKRKFAATGITKQLHNLNLAALLFSSGKTVVTGGT